VADERMISHLADNPEFLELRKQIEEDKQQEIARMGIRFFKNPDQERERDNRDKREQFVGAERYMDLPYRLADKHREMNG
jgi:hypothetical protein